MTCWAQRQAQSQKISKNGHKNTIAADSRGLCAPAPTPMQRSFRNGQWHSYTGTAAPLRHERPLAACTTTIYESLVCTSTTTTAVHNLTSLLKIDIFRLHSYYSE